MTINIFSFFKRFGISLIAGALLLAASPTAHGGHQVSRAVRTAAAVSPGTFHHWPYINLSGLDPSTFHHWPNQAASVAEIGPNTFHHWG